MVLSFLFFFFLTTFRYSVFLSLFLHCCVSLTLVPLSSTIIPAHYFSNYHFLCLHFLLVLPSCLYPYLSPSTYASSFHSFVLCFGSKFFAPPLINYFFFRFFLSLFPFCFQFSVFPRLSLHSTSRENNFFVQRRFITRGVLGSLDHFKTQVFLQ